MLTYQLWTGSLPFQADTTYALVEQQLRGPSLELSEMSEKVASAIRRCLQLDPAQRFQDVYELRNHLFQEESGRVSPPEAKLHDLLGLNYLKKDKYDLALLEFQKAIALDPHNAVHRNNCAVALYRLKQFSKAAAGFGIAVEANPTNFVISFNLGLACTALERWQEAARALRAATVLNPRFAPAYLLLGRALVKLENLHQAIEEAQKSLMLSPQSRNAHLLLAECYRQLGRVDEAASHQEMGEELKPESELRPIELESNG